MGLNAWTPKIKLNQLGIKVEHPNIKKTNTLSSYGFIEKRNKFNLAKHIKMIYGKPLNNFYSTSLDNEIKKYLLPIEFENKQPDLRELQIYSSVPENIINESLFLGVINTKIFDLIGIGPDKIYDWLNLSDIMIADTIIFDPYTVNSQLFFNVWDQGEYHPGLQNMRELFKNIGLGEKLASNTGRTSSNSSYKNCWITKLLYSEQCKYLVN